MCRATIFFISTADKILNLCQSLQPSLQIRRILTAVVELFNPFCRQNPPIYRKQLKHFIL